MGRDFPTRVDYKIDILCFIDKDDILSNMRNYINKKIKQTIPRIATTIFIAMLAWSSTILLGILICSLWTILNLFIA